MPMLPNYMHQALELMATLFIVAVGFFCLFLIFMYIRDRRQTSDAVLRNYPIVGHMRYILSDLGEFFRQYFFAMDREEMPFNRAQRGWIGRAAKNKDNTVAFGSTKYLKEPGTAIFVNCPYPTLEKDAEKTSSLVIGPYCKNPFEAKSIFNISGMSYGALSAPAVRALSKGAKMAGCWMNTGEGALSPHHLEGGCDIVFQVGTAKYGVRTTEGAFSDEKLRDVASHSQVRMFEIKMSQGAKPGKGGILPGAKVTPEIAKIRGIEQGQDSISPNRHPHINNNDDLLDFVAHIREVTGKPVGFKCVIGAYGWLEDLTNKVKERGIESAPDFITIDSADGGTGAAPMSLIDNVGLPIKESLPLVKDIIKKAGLGERIKIIASGKLITPSEVAWAMCAGADFVVSARGFMFSLGCIQALKCNKNTCPTGITTHNERLQKGLNPEDKAVKVANYCLNMVHEVETIAHSCGVPEPRRLKRFHVRMVQENGKSIPMDELYPTVIARDTTEQVIVKN
ncbi:FMN-binding glutamate synthase family protein [Endozoicomonas sp. SM1973]|uniref:FMN-binding glutamate synthase family protein n=2 Tax=Spartinivicinus marinus TaxID=2994442 RepID=A0A853IF86_9GAMM|nr:FMN-binding glutamate synthase family protein [Spartinivicinus marinus]MCX4026172.1 FMN-binding glutamate synthase family protein [Spartinivicinus marinus]NYZ68704.1 FMN-binding glutamate synthase family protein [Spartinivicinus marinus]